MTNLLRSAPTVALCFAAILAPCGAMVALVAILQ